MLFGSKHRLCFFYDIDPTPLLLILYWISQFFHRLLKEKRHKWVWKTFFNLFILESLPITMWFSSNGTSFSSSSSSSCSMTSSLVTKTSLLEVIMFSLWSSLCKVSWTRLRDICILSVARGKLCGVIWKKGRYYFSILHLLSLTFRRQKY